MPPMKSRIALLLALLCPLALFADEPTAEERARAAEERAANAVKAIPAKVTAEDQKALADALSTVQRVCSNAMEEIFFELRTAHPDLQMRKARGGFRKNDYRAFQWIVVTINDHIYWITLFYNDLDFRSGNFHTQYGRVQFWKDIHSESDPEGRQETTPNDKLQGWWRPRMDHQWKKLPPTFISQEGYSAKEVVHQFELFMAECGETLD